jgi:hypothetical protein
MYAISTCLLNHSDISISDAHILAHVCKSSHYAFTNDIALLANRTYSQKYSVVEQILIERKLWTKLLDSFPQSINQTKLEWMESLHRDDKFITFICDNMHAFYNHSKEWTAWGRLQQALSSIDLSKSKTIISFWRLILKNTNNEASVDIKIMHVFLMLNILCASIKCTKWLGVTLGQTHVIYNKRLLSKTVEKCNEASFELGGCVEFQSLIDEINDWQMHLDYNLPIGIKIYIGKRGGRYYVINGRKRYLAKA